MIRITETVKHLLIINVLIFIATMYVFPGLPEVNPFFTFLKNFQERGALYYPGSRFLHWYQLITHMFLYENFGNLFFIMFVMYIFVSELDCFLCFIGFCYFFYR